MDINEDDDYELVVFDGDSDDDSYSKTEYAYITVFGRALSTIRTTSEDYVNMWVGRYYPNCDPTTATMLVVGLDIQFVDPDSLYPPIATISLCVGGECLVYHMYDALRLPNGLQQFITDPSNAFVGVKLERKLQVLKYWAEFQGRIPYRNLGFLAESRYRWPELLHANISELALAVLRKRLVMPKVDPDWDRPVLDDGQVLDVSVRAYVCYEMGRALLTHHLMHYIMIEDYLS